MNHLEKKWKKLNNGNGSDDPVAAGKTLSRAEVIEVCDQYHLQSPCWLIDFAQLAIEALSTVHATDFKAGEVEIGIVSTSEEEDVKTRGCGGRSARKSSTNTYPHTRRRINCDVVWMLTELVLNFSLRYGNGDFLDYLILRHPLATSWLCCTMVVSFILPQ